MSAGTLIDVDAYLRTSYRPDREYRDGVVMERNVGDRSHSLLQILLGAYLVRHRDAWQIVPYTELRIRVREGWYPIPDLCVYTLPGPQERVPTVLPLLWIEILSEDDLEEIVDDVIAEVGATSMRDIGRVMADVMPQVAGRADGSAVSQLVREKLA